ncbi:hypothetical protein XENTR_v10019661 [Xenopus tropicalis]|uniref:FXYD domain-containing ion transport regulator n=1 Tax=Xenopus tropicalis TaxID=8364 RepID=A0A8J0QW27_XENTR|nr:uncharacterized protein LOC100488380 [Xenopus tropicalis]KAE8594474.1 hypothetical protein XENTR_v10019661 [Xenopus tropicalis]
MWSLLLLLCVSQLLVQGPLQTQCATEPTSPPLWREETSATSVSITGTNGSEPETPVEAIPAREENINSSLGPENVTTVTAPQDTAAGGVTSKESIPGVTEHTNEGVTTQKPRTMSTKPTTKDLNGQKGHDERLFYYDVDTLRLWGLVCALILFLLGILILMSDKCSRCSCRRRQRRKYNVTFA